MSEDDKPKKRVGSWREYLAYITKKGAFNSFGGSLLLLCILGMIGLGVLYLLHLVRLWPDVPVITGLFGSAAWGGYCTLRDARTIPVVSPPTRENLASLPVQDVLVRAAAESLDGAGKTLLRATVADGETPAEALLRPL